jgi:hypothetical protein
MAEPYVSARCELEDSQTFDLHAAPWHPTSPDVDSFLSLTLGDEDREVAIYLSERDAVLLRDALVQGVQWLRAEASRDRGESAAPAP